MTTVEFLELKQWMADRWPTLGAFTQGQWLAYRDELDRFDISNVWSALYVCFASGAEYPPNVAKLSRMTAQEEQDHERLALPGGGGSPKDCKKHRWEPMFDWPDSRGGFCPGCHTWEHPEGRLE